MKLFLACCLLCLSLIWAAKAGPGSSGGGGGRPGPVTENQEDALIWEPWYHCSKHRRRIETIRDCTPKEPGVWQTSCDGRCYSGAQTYPLFNPTAVYERCYCCKPVGKPKEVVVQLECGPSEPRTFTATCDNTLYVYFDGVLASQPVGLETLDQTTWGNTETFVVPTGTTVIGVECVDLHVYGGIMASTSDGIVTDESWVCSTQLDSDLWAHPGYAANPPNWQAAVQHGLNGAGVWNTNFGDINVNANWIWTPNNYWGYSDWDKHVYCRKEIKPLEFYTVDYKYVEIEKCACQQCPGRRVVDPVVDPVRDTAGQVDAADAAQQEEALV